MTKINWKDVAIRAGKTFVQAFVAFLMVNITPIMDSATDKTAFKTVIVSTLGGALAAGVSAAWNIIKPLFEVKNDVENH